MLPSCPKQRLKHIVPVGVPRTCARLSFQGKPALRRVASTPHCPRARTRTSSPPARSHANVGQQLPPDAAAELQSLVAAAAESAAAVIDITSPEALWPIGADGGAEMAGGGVAMGRPSDKQRWLQVRRSAAQRHAPAGVRLVS